MDLGDMNAITKGGKIIDASGRMPHGQAGFFTRAHVS
jgi:hypothetical protein